nr:MAG TPA: hypothetical protein [Caudoviricetes sp.]DAS32568.1 MAG TPA: hypothetical protein [Caudoviricetes sp.]
MIYYDIMISLDILMRLYRAFKIRSDNTYIIF